MRHPEALANFAANKPISVACVDALYSSLRSQKLGLMSFDFESSLRSEGARPQEMSAIKKALSS